jgi:parallel beta-helix repeat protein
MSSGILAGFTLTNGYTRADSDWNYQEGGGGALVTGGVISNCIATGCFASHFGGGVDLFGGDAWNCTIAGNTAYDGGGLKVQGDNAVNCLVYGNHANDSGGGVYFWESGTLDNCTVVGNVATNQGGGVYCYLGGTNLNTIIYSNSVAGAITNWTTNSGGMFQYCCTTPNPGGTGNLTNNPLFVNAAAGNYQIASNSPCINAGTNLSWMTNATDLDSNPRIVGGVVDVGAYENTNGVTANGIPWAWLLQYGLATDGSVDKLDLDGTGFNTLQDYIAGTNPTNAASCFHITSVSNLPPWTVYFGSSSNRSYTLCSRTNLTVGAWLAIPGQSNVVGAGGMMSLRDTNTAATRFYRVQVTLP